MEIFEAHKKDLSKIYGEFPEYKSFRSIIEIEYQRWATRDAETKSKLDAIMKK